MTTASIDTLLHTLAARFERHPQRHPNMAWATVAARLSAHREALKTLEAMENTGGEPDVVAQAPQGGAIVFCDCSVESPAGRRSLCYDAEALAARKANKPSGNAVDAAASMGIALLTEAQYQHLQTLGEFDLKTSSWLATPPAVRDLGGALFGDRRFGRIFTYHNGAESYYAARGFRGTLVV